MDLGRGLLRLEGVLRRSAIFVMPVCGRQQFLRHLPLSARFVTRDCGLPPEQLAAPRVTQGHFRQRCPLVPPICVCNATQEAGRRPLEPILHPSVSYAMPGFGLLLPGQPAHQFVTHVMLAHGQPPDHPIVRVVWLGHGPLSPQRPLLPSAYNA